MAVETTAVFLFGIAFVIFSISRTPEAFLPMYRV